MTSVELRRLYLDFFHREGHAVLPSSSLVPDDPTLLFTSAGMVQFKDIFWGRVAPAHPRVTTCQKCFRTTDIERVGTTAYHHTFFEMLGNFSFGDYFKEGAIELAWRFLTGELGLPPERLWVSVYEEDNEAYAIWRDEIGIPADRIVRLGKDHNWWGPVGDRGPCGPDTEIFWDWGPEYGCGPDCPGPSCDCDRFSEIWNLVFIQHDAQPDGTLRELGRKNIDTGMGLERMTAVLEGVHSNFDTDLFAPIVEAIAASAHSTLADHRSRNLVADHIRAVVFLVADGVRPGSEAQGYVLRRVLRRMVRAADALGLREGRLTALVDPVVRALGTVYPEIEERRSLVEQVIAHEEKTFRRTLRAGEARLREALAELSQEERVPGRVVFELYDTYGFPPELTKEVAGEHGFSVDWAGYEQEMEAQRVRSRRVIEADARAPGTEPGAVKAEVRSRTEFVGYASLEVESDLAAILEPAGGEVTQVGAGDWRFVFTRTPFYAEAGGQVADTGWIDNLSRPGRADVLDVQKSPHGTLHTVRVTTGEFRPGDRCRLVVDEPRRRKVERAHTATHLLHAALRRALGEHVIQAGSAVGPEEFRFDFTHFAALTPAELAGVEELAFAPVLQDLPVRVEELPLAEAKRKGAIAHFEEEYRGKDRVRVVEVPGISMELCGGTHVRRTGEIGPIVLLSEEAVGAGTRRLRVLVGEAARRHLAQLREERKQLAALLDVPEGEVLSGATKLLDEAKALRRRAESLAGELAALRSQEAAVGAREADGTKLASTIVEGGVDEAKRLADALAAQLGRSVVVIGARAEGRGIVVAKVVDEPRVSAGDLVRIACQALGGKGGGRATFAQGGGPNGEALPQAIANAIAHAEARLRGA
ncbi:MAG: alanine--tRNA ligase [Candidatus Bipolaricaulota bacterium]|nr:alanine--tRNA ligase [Candidatus Bipolaricaulota bacterium]